MVDAKKASLGVRKNKRKNQSLFKNIVAYLKCDCYMFAPLISAAHKPSSTSAAGLGMVEISRREKKRKVFEKVGEFLKSDYHMYGSMISPPKLGPPIKGHFQYTNKVTTTTEVATSTAFVAEEEQRTPQSKTLIRKDRSIERSHAEMSIQATGPDETLKQIFHQRHRSSSLSEKEKLKPKLRRVAIE